MNHNLTNDEIDFLMESNAIEGVYDDQSMQDAIKAWEFLKKQDVLDVRTVLETHKILMENQPLDSNQKGVFRKIGVRVGNDIKMDWRTVPNQVWAWCLNTMRKYPPVDDKALHIKYEHIHPFADGNGRTGRMFMNWTRLKRLNKPILIIREDEKLDYYQWFK